jgi:hypothetical protein
MSIRQSNPVPSSTINNNIPIYFVLCQPATKPKSHTQTTVMYFISCSYRFVLIFLNERHLELTVIGWDRQYSATRVILHRREGILFQATNAIGGIDDPCLT